MHHLHDERPTAVITVGDGRNGAHMKQFLDEKSYKPTFEPFKTKEEAGKAAKAKV